MNIILNKNMDYYTKTKNTGYYIQLTLHFIKTALQEYYSN